ncbi:MAG: HEAT repeat domain-containing protein [Candidatus Heimdallarchaeum aukensis]|uniref:HEAT repeat domain-containing protein n=1 Tax=Candidatus Heimdallarchaeum aukensis TaxID=2876573 RepID=A0A9Y1FLN0_9ARCH|nr:MAG: HEAT repeat domain-containing protein [Candidatus Heimdallarchaeum aukensis]
MSWKSREELDEEYFKRVREVKKKILSTEKEPDDKQISVQEEDILDEKLLDKEKDFSISTETTFEKKEEESYAKPQEIEVIEEQAVAEKETIDYSFLVNILEKAKEGKKKERLSSIDDLSQYLDKDEVIQSLVEIARKDPYHICRAKAVSILADKIKNRYVKDLILEQLKDSSKEVRKWVIWALKSEIQDKAIQDALIRHLMYTESSKEIKMWIINALSSCIDNEDVEYTFLRLIKSSLSFEIRSLIIDALLPKIYDSEVLYGLSNHLFKEPDKTIRKKIILALKKINNMDAKFTLERFLKIEKDKELKALLSSTSN